MAKKTTGPREALLVIDMLNDFCLEGAPLYVPSTGDVIPNIARELKRAREAGTPVIYVCDAHVRDDPEFAYWPPHALAGSDGAMVVDELAPLPGEVVIEKTTLSCFHGTRLPGALRKARISTLTVTGCVTEICVLMTVFEGMTRGFRVRVIKDCVAGLTQQMHEFALREMEEVLKAEVI